MKVIFSIFLIIGLLVLFISARYLLIVPFEPNLYAIINWNLPKHNAESTNAYLLAYPVASILFSIIGIYHACMKEGDKEIAFLKNSFLVFLFILMLMISLSRIQSVSRFYGI